MERQPNWIIEMRLRPRTLELVREAINRTLSPRKIPEPTPSDLCMLTKNDLLKTRNLGRKRLKEVEETLARYGLQLRSESFAVPSYPGPSDTTVGADGMITMRLNRDDAGLIDEALLYYHVNVVDPLIGIDYYANLASPKGQRTYEWGKLGLRITGLRIRARKVGGDGGLNPLEHRSQGKSEYT